MILAEVQITNLRNLLEKKLTLHRRFTIITGNNGSGKTSCLEAIYLLSAGHSFRVRDLASLISFNQDPLTVFARTLDDQRISVQKSQRSPTVARINGENCSNRSQLAFFMPCQLFYNDLFDFINAGPTVRRAVLDWGMFHVEHHYHSLWKEYRQILRQRNALLKQQPSRAQLAPWDHQMVNLAVQLDQFRELYVQQLSAQFTPILQQLSDINCSLRYYRGWTKRSQEEPSDLLTIIQQSYQSDCLRQFTQHGAHQADLQLITATGKVKSGLSRGQQKIVLFALKFAQSKLLSRPCIYLMDDLAAELDEHHIKKLLYYLDNVEGQFILTSHDEHRLTSYINDYSLISLS